MIEPFSSIMSLLTDPLFFDALLSGTFVLVVVFCLTWLVARFINNYGVVDVVWGFSLVAMAIWLGSHLQLKAPVHPVRVWVVMGLVVLEYGRLGLYITQRFFHEYPAEDSRYATCRKAWGSNAHVIMLLAYGLQALLIFAMMYPVAWVASRPGVLFGAIEWAGLLLWLAGFVTELVADAQLKRFKQDVRNKGAICSEGLWSLSRHPNYFGQWLQWCGFAVMALAQPYGWLMLYIPMLMYLFLTRVTGIQITEQTMLEKYGKAFEAYREQTPAFFPKFF